MSGFQAPAPALRAAAEASSWRCRLLCWCFAGCYFDSYSLENLVVFVYLSLRIQADHVSSTAMECREKHTQSTAFRAAHVYRPLPSFHPLRLATIDRPPSHNLGSATSRHLPEPAASAPQYSTRPTELASVGAYLMMSYVFLPQLSCVRHDVQQPCGALEDWKRAKI
jgi:hypothetical protein